MEESKKKPLMIGIIVVCLVVAGIITFATRSGPDIGIPDSYKKEQVWLKCRDPKCDAEYQMNMAEYYELREQFRQEHPRFTGEPPMTCPECGQQSAYLAAKCSKCGTIFEVGWKRGDYEDRCPKCGYSQIEVDRKEKAEAQKKGQ